MSIVRTLTVLPRASLGMVMLWSATAEAADKPNILVIWGDDIGT